MARRIAEFKSGNLAPPTEFPRRGSMSGAIGAAQSDWPDIAGRDLPNYFPLGCCIKQWGEEGNFAEFYPVTLGFLLPWCQMALGATGSTRPEAEVGCQGKRTFNVEVTGAARLYRAASVWTAGLGEIDAN